MSEFERQQKQARSSFTVRPTRPDRAMHAEHATGREALGNQAAQRFAQSCPAKAPSPAACPFGGACHACPARVQTKLTVGEPDDEYEQEADRVADQVMAMPEPYTHIQRACATCSEEEPLQTKRLAAQITPLVQRQAEPDEDEEEPVQTKSSDSTSVPRQDREPQEEPIQAKRSDWQAPQISPKTAAHIHSLQGGGQSLPQSACVFFESRFGRGFRDVRVHANEQAAGAARAVNAHAFTVGQNIVFGTGQYAPGTVTGTRLIAHELTHVIQQSRGKGIAPPIQRLGANPGCTAAERTTVRQAIYDARGWINKAIAKLEATPVSAQVIASLGRNFGPTYGVVANIPLIVGRLRTVSGRLGTIPFGCAGAADATCAGNHCGYASGAGRNTVTICRNVTLTAGTSQVFQAGCVLHECLHASFTNFTVDEYSGWHGESTSTPTYPGGGTDPLLNADSYTTLVIDLS